MRALKMSVRRLEPDDIPALLVLEHAKWAPHQAASAASLLARIQAFPDLCIGAFCAGSGQAQASLFMCPVIPAMFSAPTRWEAAAGSSGACRVTQVRSLFGISLSSKNPNAVNAIFKFFYPHALKAGWNEVFLGSPIPGFRAARFMHPGLSVWEYVHAKRTPRAKDPLDPQLRYYFQKGFRQIVSIHEDYFPHGESLDYGVILRCAIPLARAAPLWRITPLFLIESLLTLGLWLARKGLAH